MRVECFVAWVAIDYCLSLNNSPWFMWGCCLQGLQLFKTKHENVFKEVGPTCFMFLHPVAGWLGKLTKAMHLVHLVTTTPAQGHFKSTRCVVVDGVHILPFVQGRNAP